MTQSTTFRLGWLLLPATIAVLALTMAFNGPTATAAPAPQDSDTNANATITDTVDSDTKSAIDFIMYLRSQPQDADTCAMTVEDGQVVIDPSISNPAMSCPDMFAWKLFVDAIQQEFWTNWATDQYTFPQDGPLPLCAADATDTSACCTPGSDTNPGYDDPDNPGTVCPYFPGDHLAEDEMPNMLEANPLSKAQISHFHDTIGDNEPGRVIRQEMAEIVFRNKVMFDYVFENNLYNTDGLSEVFERASSAMQEGAPYHQQNVTGDLVRIDLPVDAVMIKSNWLHEDRAAELGIVDDPDNPFIKMTLNSKVIDNNAEIFEPGVHYMVALHISSKDIPQWVWATFEHVNNPGRCDMIGCNDAYGYRSPDAVQANQYQNFIAPHQMSDDLLIPTTIFDNGKTYAGDVRTPALESIFLELGIGTTTDETEIPTTTDRAWLSYRLKGSQTNFTDSIGYPTLLGNSVTEAGFVLSSSCIGCHARSAIGSDGSAALGVFIEQLAEDGYAQSSFGPPDPNWYFSSSSNPTLEALPFDFIWGVLFAQPLATDQSDDAADADTADTDAADDDASTAEATADPFAYCAEVGTTDAPEGDFGASNPGVPAAVAAGLKVASGAADDAPMEMFEENSYWRCMDGHVYACTVGANLPCAEKADTSTTPTDAMNEFCADQPDADVIPAYVTGHATVYNWRCVDGEAEAGKQVLTADAQGYIAEFWYEIEPSAE